jgi:hypothetical protein
MDRRVVGGAVLHFSLPPIKAGLHNTIGSIAYLNWVADFTFLGMVYYDDMNGIGGVLVGSHIL